MTETRSKSLSIVYNGTEIWEELKPYLQSFSYTDGTDQSDTSMRLSKTLHASGEDYLEIILVLQKKLGMVRSVDVARHMEVSKPSVCHAVATLRDGGFLTMDEDHFLHLTDVGREVAERIYERHCFFTEQLIAAGVDPRTAEADACRIEHIISDESFSRLKEAAAQEQD